MRCNNFSFHVLGIALGLALCATGCGTAAKDGPLAERTIRVVTTTTMITDAVKIVGGKRVDVAGLMGAGIDPHEYEASAGDVTRMERADIIFYNGLHLEGKMGEVFAKMSGKTKTVAVADGIPKDQIRAVLGIEGGHDPHVWFDVTLWMKAVEQVRDSLVALDPKHAETFRANAKKHVAELADLHEYVKKQAARIPPQQRVLVTAHDAFSYFARAYGFEVRGLQGVSTAAEASISDVAKLAEFIAQRRIPAMFVESSVPKKNIEAVQAAVKRLGFAVDIGGELFSDALGDPGTPKGTYVGMVRHNIDTMVKALMRD